jgi:NifU-like protein involved in Fe-S cluster formation
MAAKIVAIKSPWTAPASCATYDDMIDPDLLDLYSARLKELGAQVKDDRPLTAPEATVKRRSPLCGSQVTFDVTLDDQGRVAAVGFAVRACSLAEAASAIVIAQAVGSPLDELVAVRDAVKRMLREKVDALPGGKWADLDVLKPAQMVPARHGSALLPFDAMVKAVEKAHKARTPQV